MIRFRKDEDVLTIFDRCKDEEQHALKTGVLIHQ